MSMHFFLRPVTGSTIWEAFGDDEPTFHLGRPWVSGPATAAVEAADDIETLTEVIKEHGGASEFGPDSFELFQEFLAATHGQELQLSHDNE